LNKDKKSSNFAQKKRTNEPKSKTDKWKILKTKKNYLLILKKFDNVIDYKNIKLLKAFNEIWSTVKHELAFKTAKAL
jgi:ribosomal protein S18